MNKKYDIYSIHYSCSGFYNGGAVAPTICCIALYNIKTNKIKAFSLQNGIKQGKSIIESEQILLQEFVEFFGSIKNPFIIHWGMDSLEFGFKAIMARCENFGIDEVNLDKIIDFNLAKYSNYNLLGTLEINDCKSVSVLSGKEEVLCFNKRDYNMVKHSTETKAYGLAEVFKKYVDGNWSPNKETSENTEKELINTPTGLKLYKMLSDITSSAEQIYKIINILKTDSDKEYIIKVIEQGKTNINLLEFLAYEYMNGKKVA